ncbi:unnamed protein product [Ilex paraguariensis]|uniref:Exocyst complex component Sec10-like alpha-helical bundle domain-containing protein n=1 Tax=Ilex paraguariensis TaxID=185542 RepID=A0ABC8U7F9_9AQUA
MIVRNYQDVEELMSLPPEKILLRWMNFQPKKVGYKKIVANFSSDVKYFVISVYWLLLPLDGAQIAAAMSVAEGTAHKGLQQCIETARVVAYLFHVLEATFTALEDLNKQAFLTELEVENRLLTRFDAASQRRELSTMAECPKILSQFNKGTGAMQHYIGLCPMFDMEAMNADSRLVLDYQRPQPSLKYYP